MFYWERGIALQAMPGNRASSGGEREVSWFFESGRRNLGYIIELRRGWHFKTHFFFFSNVRTPFCDEGHLGNLHQALQHDTDASQGDAGDRESLSSCHRVIGFPINFQE